MTSAAPPPSPARFKNQASILWIETAGFSLLLVFSWLSELLGVPHLLFSDSAQFNWARALARSAIVIAVWLSVHLATRRLLKRLRYLEDFPRVCSWCRKIGHEGGWMTTEEFFDSAFAADTSHGICPECSNKLLPRAAVSHPAPPVSEWKNPRMD